MRKPYIFEKRRIAKNQSDRRDSIEKLMDEKGHMIEYVEDEEEGDDNGEDRDK